MPKVSCCLSCCDIAVSAQQVPFSYPLFSRCLADAKSPRAGTGGPPPNSTFKGCDGNTYKRNAEGGIPDEIGKDHQRITNAPGTLSMANTGRPESGGSQFFINVNHNSFLDWFDRSSPSAHPVFGKVGFECTTTIHNEENDAID